MWSIMAFLFSFDSPEQGCSQILIRQVSFAEVSAPLLVAAVREDDFSREPARIIRGKKHGHARNVLGLPQAAQRRIRNDLLLKLRSHDARRVRTLRFGSTGTESVNADFSGAELF